MAIISANKQVGKKTKLGWEIVSSVEVEENQHVNVNGIAIGHRNDSYALFGYRPDDFEGTNHPCDHGDEQYLWASYFRRCQQVLNAWILDQEKKARNEGKSRN